MFMSASLCKASVMLSTTDIGHTNRVQSILDRFAQRFGQVFFITREWVSSARSNFVLVKERPVVYLYFVTRQWRNTAIWTLVKSAPTQNLMPPPKAMKYLDAPFISPPCKQINLRYILLITKFIIRAFNCFVSHRCPPRTKEITRV